MYAITTYEHCLSLSLVCFAPTAINSVILSFFVVCIIEIINNTRGGIVIFFSENKRECSDWGANSSPGCRAKR